MTLRSSTSRSAERTTYRVGGAAALFVAIDSDLALERVVDAVSTTGIDVFVLGNGSNLLVADSGFRGLCVVLGGRFAEIAIDHQRAAVEAGAGAFVSRCSRARAQRRACAAWNGRSASQGRWAEPWR